MNSDAYHLVVGHMPNWITTLPSMWPATAHGATCRTTCKTMAVHFPFNLLFNDCYLNQFLGHSVQFESIEIQDSTSHFLFIGNPVIHPLSCISQVWNRAPSLLDDESTGAVAVAVSPQCAYALAWPGQWGIWEPWEPWSLDQVLNPTNLGLKMIKIYQDAVIRNIFSNPLRFSSG